MIQDLGVEFRVDVWGVRFLVSDPGFRASGQRDLLRCVAVWLSSKAEILEP